VQFLVVFFTKIFVVCLRQEKTFDLRIMVYTTLFVLIIHDCMIAIVKLLLNYSSINQKLILSAF